LIAEYQQPLIKKTGSEQGGIIKKRWQGFSAKNKQMALISIKAHLISAPFSCF